VLHEHDDGDVSVRVWRIVLRRNCFYLRMRGGERKRSWCGGRIRVSRQMIFGVVEHGSRWWRKNAKRRVGMAVMETASSDKITEDFKGRKEGGIEGWSRRRKGGR